jgi:hypothetical protein
MVGQGRKVISRKVWNEVKDGQGIFEKYQAFVSDRS